MYVCIEFSTCGWPSLVWRVPNSTTILELKQMLHTYNYDHWLSMGTLTFNGRIVWDHQTLKSIGAKDGDWLQAVPDLD